MTFRFASIVAVSILLLAISGCSSRVDSGGDSGSGIDAGDPPADTGPSETDSARADTGTTPADSGPEPTDSGPGPSDGGPAPVDAAPSEVDSCVPPPCPAPPPGCRYEGGSLCECGTLVCPGAACDPACNAGEYCDLCARPDAVCRVRPPDEGRICATIYMPVCGCDGMTYSNACTLGSAGIMQMHTGECESTGP